MESTTSADPFRFFSCCSFLLPRKLDRSCSSSDFLFLTSSAYFRNLSPSADEDGVVLVAVVTVVAAARVAAAPAEVLDRVEERGAGGGYRGVVLTTPTNESGTSTGSSRCSIAIFVMLRSGRSLISTSSILLQLLTAVAMLGEENVDVT